MLGGERDPLRLKRYVRPLGINFQTTTKGRYTCVETQCGGGGGKGGGGNNYHVPERIKTPSGDRISMFK